MLLPAPNIYYTVDGEVGSLSVLEKLTNGYIQSGDVAGPIVSRMKNALKQAKHHDEKGRTDQAIHFIEKYLDELDHLTKKDAISPLAKKTLFYHASLLLKQWKSE